MKKIILSGLFTVALATGAWAQGTVTFANIGSGLNSPFTVDGVKIAASSGFTVELLAGADANSLTSVKTFSGTFANGYFNGGTTTIGNITGDTGTFQVRAWANNGGQVSSYDAALTAGLATAIGNTFVTTVQTDPQLTPKPLVGMQALNLTAVSVPEPGTVILGLLGGVALLARRRKAVA